MRLAQTPHAFLLKTRVQRAADRLTDPQHSSSSTIADIACSSGFSALSVFNRAFRDHYKLSPGELRHRAAL
ncbi:helix-turn-helix domain-containing protein [Nocardia sp. NBC_01388]|uniref:helix-turn-helix domain-containing protein n=1 Tax=Nocardia sp. NBC_01388 TaxID=2903596 RepID=UPI00386AFC66